MYNRILKFYGLHRRRHDWRLCGACLRCSVFDQVLVKLARNTSVWISSSAIDACRSTALDENKSISVTPIGRSLSKKKNRRLLYSFRFEQSLKDVKLTPLRTQRELISSKSIHYRAGIEKDSTAYGKEVPSPQAEGVLNESNGPDCGAINRDRDSDKDSECSRQDNELDGFSSSSNSCSGSSGDNSSSSGSSSNTSNSSDSSVSSTRRKKRSKSCSDSSNDGHTNNTELIENGKKPGIEVSNASAPALYQEEASVDVDTNSESSGDGDDEFESDCEELYPFLPPAPVDELVLPWKQFKRQQIDSLLAQNRDEMIKAILRRQESQLCKCSSKTAIKKDLVQVSKERGSSSTNHVLSSRNEAADDSGYWIMECSCGVGGVGVDDGQLLVECEKCKHWLHMKCAKQRLDVTSDKELPEPFYCFECEWTVDCICGVHCMNYDDYQRMIQCDVCSSWQHTLCAGILDSEEPPNTYKCSKCLSKEVSALSTHAACTKAPVGKNAVLDKEPHLQSANTFDMNTQAERRQKHKHRKAESKKPQNEESHSNELNASTRMATTQKFCPPPEFPPRRTRSDVKVKSSLLSRSSTSKSAARHAELEDVASHPDSSTAAKHRRSEGVQKRAKSVTTRPVNMKRRRSVHERLEQKIKHRRKKT
uniref:Uncharacterized protein AlNc14C56G4261 n=1 Tax=Albugo laibachii Nc14 TaxID=890382 RepID=F0WC78_9STRA|nr:conserved hypothetical protein [Albugo laibachii Nc14]|eukprot:CCA18791.1 conserved hypothetical protein [Albugo laibachii Nc14]